MEREFLSRFKFENYACDCVIESRLNEATGKLENNLVVKIKKDKLIPMHYIYGNGLKIVNDRSIKEKNNVIGEFLSIKKYDLEKYKSYFEKYGFLFKTDSDDYFRISSDDLEILQNNLKAFIFLMNNQIDSRLANLVNTTELLDGVLYLLFKDKRDITYEDSTVFSVCDSFIKRDIFGMTDNPEIGNATFITVEGQKVQAFKIFDNVTSKYTIMYKDAYFNLIADYSSHMCKNIIRLYKSKDNIIKPEFHLTIDFLYHLISEYIEFDVNDISLEGTFESNLYADLKENESLFNALINVSKLILKHEFESNLSYISPSYDVENMKPDWHLPSLYTAMYYSLFYLDAKDVGYRKCANPRCNEYFEVSKTNTIKKYCDSFTCGNAVNQRNYQKRKQHRS